jgi:hypothetical protein
MRVYGKECDEISDELGRLKKELSEIEGSLQRSEWLADIAWAKGL